MTPLKSVQFTVRATQSQAIRWNQASAADGHRAVGSWLSEAADAYLKVRERAGRPVPLAWHRGRFRVILASGEEVMVRGMVSFPFGCFPGSAEGPDVHHGHRTLVHIPSREVIATLRSARQAKALASELAPTWLRDRELAAGVVARHQRESV